MPDLSRHARDCQHWAQLQWHFLGKNLPGPSLPHSFITQAAGRPPALLQPHAGANLHPVQWSGTVELPGLATASPVLLLQPAGAPRQLRPAPASWARWEVHIVFPPFQQWSCASFSSWGFGNPLETVVSWAATLSANAAPHCNSQVRCTWRAAQQFSGGISWTLGQDQKALSDLAHQFEAVDAPKNIYRENFLSPPIRNIQSCHSRTWESQDFLLKVTCWIEPRSLCYSCVIQLWSCPSSVILPFSPFALQDSQLANPLSWQSFWEIRAWLISFSIPNEAAAYDGGEGNTVRNTKLGNTTWSSRLLCNKQ